MLDFSDALNVVVVGASGGIGRGFVNHLAKMEHVKNIYAFSRSDQVFDHDKVISGHLDLMDEDSIKAAADFASEGAAPDIVIVATGILHDGDALQPEKSMRDITHESFEKVFALNTTGPALVAKHFLPKFDRENHSVFAALSARVGSISDNGLGGWYAYRASKAALNMVIKNCAIEMGRRYKNAVIIGLHPGTVDTGLSEPFQSNVPEAKLFSPDYASECLLKVLGDLKPKDSGKIFDWAGQEIQP